MGPHLRRVGGGALDPECSFNLEAEKDSRLWGKDKFHLRSVVGQVRLSGELEVETPISTLIFKNRLGQGSRLWHPLHCARPPSSPPFFCHRSPHPGSPGGSQTQMDFCVCS